MTDTRDTLTTGQVARLTRVAPRTVSQWHDSGKLPGYRIPTSRGPGDRRFRRADVLAFLRQHGMPTDLLGPGAVLVATPDAALAAAAGGVRVANGFDLGRRFAAGHVACVVLDFALGRSECLAIAPHLAGVPVVAVCGEDEPDEAGLRGRGFAAVFRRPCDFAAVAKTVWRLGGVAPPLPGLEG